MFRRSVLYIQVFPDHFAARVVGEDKRVRRDCHALDNARGDPDFSKVRETLRSLVKDLVPGFSLRKPTALLHFIPAHYQPTQRSSYSRAPLNGLASLLAGFPNGIAQIRTGNWPMSSVRSNNAFKPKLHRYAVHMAERACHVASYALQFGLT